MAYVKKGGLGGARPGAGKPKGHKAPSTLEKEEARALLRRLVFARLEPIVTAQISQAEGIKYLVTRGKDGKFVRVGPAMAGALDETTIEVWEKDPSTPAATDLLNRTLDKPTEHVDMNVTDTDARRARLNAAKLRSAKR